MDYLRDANHVWRFQSYFGIRKVKEAGSRNGGPWVALESKLMPTPLPDNVKVPLLPQLSATSFEREHRYDLRVRAVRKNPCDDEVESTGSSGYSSETEAEEEANIIYYEITNYFWFLVFTIGTSLGDETLLAPVFAFVILNLDGGVGRKALLVYSLMMYIGQGIKDTVRWPRPQMPPVVQMERKWALEYGMPSTHSMVGLAVPATVVYVTMGKYEFSLLLAILVSCVWCAAVCTSRLYLGMHSVADLVVGIILALILFPPLVIFAEGVDEFLTVSPVAPLLSISCSLLMVWLYPGSDRWTPARGETTAILGSYMGVHLGYWLLFQVGAIVFEESAEWPLAVHTPSGLELAAICTRSAVSILFVGLTRAAGKPVFYTSACFLLGVDRAELDTQSLDNNKKRLAVELSYKFLTYIGIGFNVVFVASLLFLLVGCERATFFTER